MKIELDFSHLFLPLQHSTLQRGKGRLKMKTWKQRGFTFSKISPFKAMLNQNKTKTNTPTLNNSQPKVANLQGIQGITSLILSIGDKMLSLLSLATKISFGRSINFKGGGVFFFCIWVWICPFNLQTEFLILKGLHFLDVSKNNHFQDIRIQHWNQRMKKGWHFWHFEDKSPF